MAKPKTSSKPDPKDLAISKLLSIAVLLEHPEAVAAMLKLGGDPNAVMPAPPGFDKFPEDGDGPMVNAVRVGNVDILKALIKANGNPNLPTRSGRPLPELAKALKNKKVTALLAQYKPAPLDLKGSVAAGDVTRVVELIKKEGPDAALILAAQLKQFDVLEAIMNTNVRKSEAIKSEALWHAVYNGNEQEAYRLMLYGARPSHYDKKTKLTTLGAAKAKKLTALAKTLVERGATMKPS